MVKCLECKINDIKIINSEDKIIFYCKKCKTNLVSQDGDSVMAYYDAFKKQRKLPLALKNAEEDETSLTFKIALAIAQDLQDRDQIDYCNKKINELKKQEDTEREEAIKLTRLIIAQKEIEEAELKEKEDQEEQEKKQTRLDEEQELERELSKFEEEYQKSEFYGDWLEKRGCLGDDQYPIALELLMTKIYDKIKNYELVTKLKPLYVSKDGRTVVYPKHTVNQINPPSQSTLELQNDYQRIRSKLVHIDERLYPKFETVCDQIRNDERPRLLSDLKNELRHPISSVNTCGENYYVTDHPKFEDSVFSHIILDNKSNNDTASDYLTNIMLDTISRNPKLKDVDVVVPVPNMDPNLYKNNERIRDPISCGVSLALKLAKSLNKLCDVNALKKIESSGKRKSDTIYVRKARTERSYVIGDNQNIQNKKVLLVDDVHVNGHTVCKCANLLISNGARHVKIICAAQSVGVRKKYGY